MKTRKVALVTGASSGIGEATALRLARMGYLVYGAARRVDRMSELQARGIRLLSMDVTDDATMTAGVTRILADNDRLDVIVNNAGYGSYGALEDVPLAEARRQFEVNVFGLARLTQLVLPTMRAQRSGRIINMSSMGGKIYEPLGGWYHATKFAVEGLSDSLRLELRPFGIHVVIIEPGAIITEWNQIARDNLLATSGDTAYARLAESVTATMAAADVPGASSPPDVVARAVARAVRAWRPKTRYPVGKHARSAVLGRRLLPDVVMDAVLWQRFVGSG